MRWLGATMLALGGLWLAPNGRAQPAEQAPGPELDFLEYLGAWAEADDEWLAIEEWQKGNGRDDGDDADEDGGKRESEDVEGE